MKRREFLKTVGAVGAAASAQAQSSSRPRRIDIHNHYYPSSYFQMIEDLAGDDYAFDTDATVPCNRRSGSASSIRLTGNGRELCCIACCK